MNPALGYTSSGLSGHSHGRGIENWTGCRWLGLDDVFHAKGHAHGGGQSLGRLSVVISLTNPHLGDILDIDRWHGGVQGHLIEHTVNGSGEKDQSHAPDGLDIEVE